MWKLKWFFFDALEVMYKEAPGCTGTNGRASVAYDYFGDVLHNAQSIGDIEAAAPDRIGNEPLLIGLARTAIAKAVAAAGPMRYPWPSDAWPTSLGFYDRPDPYGNGAMSMDDGVFIDADTACLPWPLPLLLKNGTDVARLTDILGVKTQSVSRSAVSANTLLRAFDAAYAENTQRLKRDQFKNLTEPQRAPYLIAEASSSFGRGLFIPSGTELPFARELPVGPLDTNQTYFQWTGSALRFVMGLNNPPAGNQNQAPSPSDLPDQSDPGAHPVFVERIPCGSFVSK